LNPQRIRFGMDAPFIPTGKGDSAHNASSDARRSYRTLRPVSTLRLISAGDLQAACLSKTERTNRSIGKGNRNATACGRTFPKFPQI